VELPVASISQLSDLHYPRVAQVKFHCATTMRSNSLLERLFTRSRFAVAVTVSVALILAGAAKLGAVSLLLHIGAGRRVLQGQDAIITGILTACLVWVMLRLERARRREREKQIRAVANLNHEVRNALDVIVCSEYLGTGRGTAIVESVERINSALYEITAETPQESTRHAGFGI
jgi:hypothetical protein